MRKYILLILAMILVLSGCGSKNEEKQGDGLPFEVPVIIDVALSITPEHIEVGEPVTISAKVTQADENVEDADKVVFELWKKGDEEHDMIDGKHQGQGVYSIEKTFSEEGLYYVISHVDARSMHNMPKNEFVVGNPEDHADATTDNEESGQSQHHDHTSITIELEIADGIEVKQETVLIANILTADHNTLTGADVQFEVWQEGDEKHYYIVASEVDDHYQATTTFEKQGKYNVRIHVLKGDLHDHVEDTVEVK